MLTYTYRGVAEKEIDCQGTIDISCFPAKDKSYWGLIPYSVDAQVSKYKGDPESTSYPDVTISLTDEDIKEAIMFNLVECNKMPQEQAEQLAASIPFSQVREYLEFKLADMIEGEDIEVEYDNYSENYDE